MVPAYHNVRATGGAVKPLPWRGLRGLGRRLKPLLMKKGLGLMEEPRVYPRKPCMGNPCKIGHRGLPYNVRFDGINNIANILVRDIRPRRQAHPYLEDAF